jgi:hypothetical protein
MSLRTRGGRKSAFIAVVLSLALSAALVLSAIATAAAPTVTIEPASEVGFSTIKAEGHVTPGGKGTSYRFDFITDQQYVENEANGVPPFEGASQGGWGYLEGSTETPVEAVLEGLTAGTEYHLRLFAENADGTETAVASTFTTQTATAPTAAIDPATGIGYTKAHLSGTVNPEGGNVNPAGGPVSINWELQVSTTAGEGFSAVASGTIAGTEAESTTPIVVEGEPTTLHDATEYHYRLVANYAGKQAVSGEGTFETEDATPPTVTLLPTTDITPYSVEAHATINPNGAETLAWFEYSKDGGATWHPAPYFSNVGPEPAPLACKTFAYPCPPTLEGNSAVPFDAKINEHDYNTNLKAIDRLEPNTTYLLRIHAQNAGGAIESSNGTFKTSPVPPVVQSLGVVPTPHGSSLWGRVNPRNNAVTYQFEWGPLSGEGDETYENVSPASPQALGASDNALHSVTSSIGGLQPNTTYHFRLVAVDTEHDVKATGEERIFTTPAEPSSGEACPNATSRVGASAALPDCRAYEWANPDFNSVASLPAEWQFAEASEDGAAVKFRTQDAPANAEGSMVFSLGVSRRTADGWVARSLSPPSPEPYESMTAGLVDPNTLSPDWSEWLVVSSLPLAGDRPKGEANIYLHRADGSYEALTKFGRPYSTSDYEFHIPSEVGSASADFSHIFFSVLPKQLPIDPFEPADPRQGNLYEWSAGELRLVGFLPPAVPGGEELPAPRGAALAGGALPAISADGTRVLFQEPRADQNGFEPGLYVRIDADKTVDASRSTRSAVDPNPRVAAQSVGISADGSTALFISKNELTDESNTGESEGVSNDLGADLYSYDADSGALTDLTVATGATNAERGADVQMVVGASADASYIYFVAKGELAPGGVSGERNLYVWHNGSIKYIASVSTGLSQPGEGFYVAADGRHVAFLVKDQLTPYDNAGHSEVYLYTYGGAVSCASCRPDGQPPTGEARMHGQALNADGTRAFFESDDQVLSAATNGAMNVYEYSVDGPRLLSPGTGRAAHFFGASASGDDVFIATYEELVPGSGTSFGIYDARVDAEVPQPAAPPCKGESCRGAPSSAHSGGASSSGGNRPMGIAGPSVVSGRSHRLKVRFTVPEAGRLNLHGKAVRAASKRARASGSVVVTVALKKKQARRWRSGHTVRAVANVGFRADDGQFSKTHVSLRFLGAHKKSHGAHKKGGK